MTALPRPTQTGHVLRLLARWWTVPVAGVGLMLVLVVSTARVTLLDPHYDARAVARTHAYERLYTEVLPAPQARQAVHRVLSRLPVDPSFSTANIRLLLPPATLQEVVDRALSATVQYLLGARTHIDGAVVLEPVVSRAEQLARNLLPGAVTGLPAVTQSSLQKFSAAFTRFVVALRAGRVPHRLPTLPLSGAALTRVSDVLTSGLDADASARVTPQLRLLLAAGNLSGALALVAPSYVAADPDIGQAVTRRIGHAAASLRDPLRTVAHDPTVRTLRTAHDVLPAGLATLTILGGLLLAAALLLSARAARRRGSSVLAAIAVAAVGGSLVALLAGWLLARALPDPLRVLIRSADLPPSLATILRDIDDQLRSGVAASYLRLVGLALLAGAAVAAVALADRVRRRGWSRGRRPVLAVGAVAVVLGGLASFPRPVPIEPDTCNGFAALCEHRYDAVVYLAAHNAMASSDSGFVDASQDPDMVGQLDNGVRALLIDTHYWTTPEEVASYLQSLPASTRQALAPALTVFEDRPGLWLCHVVCQLGALPAVPALHQVKVWLDKHPDAVVTLIIEDHTTRADTEAIIERSGLRHYVQTPPAQGAPWPTLGEMVRTGHRLVAFTERSDDPDSWLRDYHVLGAETPFDAATIADLTCAPGRGPETAPLFLLNNWISTPAPSRAQAAQVNRPAALLHRVHECEQARGMRPTYVAVEFAQVGDPLKAVDRLNGVTRRAG